MTADARILTARLLAPFLFVAIAATPAPADRLLLDNGRHIDVERWWLEGDVVVYEADGGTVGIPRAMIVRIDDSPPPTRDTPASRARPATGSTPARQGAADDEARIRENLRRAQDALEKRDFELASSHYWP
jgi:hypothetical protein